MPTVAETETTVGYEAYRAARERAERFEHEELQAERARLRRVLTKATHADERMAEEDETTDPE
jgi:hypothetical protein